MLQEKPRRIAIAHPKTISVKTVVLKVTPHPIATSYKEGVMGVMARLIAVLLCLHAAAAGPACPVNSSFFPPLTCPDGYGCCKMPATLVCADEAPPCTSCAFCCHSYLNASQCAACHADNCAGQGVVGDAGCNTSTPTTWVPYLEPCCARGMPLPASPTLKNVMLIGDSVMDGQSALVAEMMKDVARVQFWGSAGLNAPIEAACWGTHRVAAVDGSPIHWDVIVFNEGLHSLWPRTNVSDASGAAYAGALKNWTQVLQLPSGGITPTLVYATMTCAIPADCALVYTPASFILVPSSPPPLPPPHTTPSAPSPPVAHMRFTHVPRPPFLGP